MRTLASGVSRGTEALVFAGRVPPSQYQAMRAPLMGGAFPFPVKYGYSAVGRVPDGRRVFVLHPHQDVFLAPGAMCIPVPDGVPTHRAVLAANMETALNLTWDAAPLAGERMLVIGAGVVGLLTASLLARIPAAQRHGGGHRSGARNPRPAVRLRLRRTGCRASRAGADRARIGQRSRTSCSRWTARPSRRASSRQAGSATRHRALPLGEAFHARRLRLIATQVGAVAQPMRGRRSHAERLALALELLADARYDALLDGPTRFEDMPRDDAAHPRARRPVPRHHLWDE